MNVYISHPYIQYLVRRIIDIIALKRKEKSYPLFVMKNCNRFIVTQDHKSTIYLAPFQLPNNYPGQSLYRSIILKKG